MKNIIVGLTFLLLMTGCSTKNIYEPQKIDSEIEYGKTLNSKLTDVSRDGATYENGQIITKNSGLLDAKIPKGFRFVNASNGDIIITKGTGEMKILDSDGKVVFEKNFEAELAGGMLKNNILAMIFVNNTIMLYDIKEANLIYKESLTRVSALDARLANPIFLNDLIVIATLDGRLLIIDAEKKVILRDVAISDKALFNNVIFLQYTNDTIVAATSSKVISINPKTIETFNASIRDVIYDDKKVFVFTKDGRVVLLDDKLKMQKELKFQYAVFSAVSEGDKLYIIEKNGYLIEIEKDLSSYKVLKLPDEVDYSLFAYGNKIYFDDKYIELK